MKYKTGSIHGRFQPFHKGHARYLNAALDRCEHLIIGITQFDIQNLGNTPEANHRSNPANNPLTYNQRCEIIAAYLQSRDIPNESYSFTPFPIEEPHKIKDFIPLETVCFTTLHHATWNEAKRQKLEEQGFNVEVLMNPDETQTNDLSATRVREFIRANDENWRHFLPESSAEKLVEVGGIESIVLAGSIISK